MKRVFCAAAMAMCMLVSVSAQQLKEVEFKNQAITDILLALAQLSGKSIVPDETVTGTASYYFTQTDFETALQIFLTTYKMYFWKDGNIYYVSKIKTAWSKEAGTAAVDADEVEIRLIVRALSKAIGKTILFDTLPRENLTVHVENTKPDKVLEMLVKRFPEYKVETTADYYYIRRAVETTTAGTGSGGTARPGTLVSLQGSLYSVNTDKARLRDILLELFQKAGVEYSLFLRSDSIVENIHFKDKPFQDILHLVLQQANADYAIENGIYYVFDIQRADVLKKLKEIRTVSLTYISVQDLPNLFPQDMASQSLFRVDRNTNSVILSGSDDEIGPVIDFIASIDKPLLSKRYYRFDLTYLKVADLAGILPAAFSGMKPTAIPQTNSFVMLLSPDGKKLLDDYLDTVDMRQAGAPIHLRYIQADTLLKSLPPSVAKEEVLQTTDPTLVFFTGTEEKQAQFRRELEMIDRPQPQVRYDLLVVEHLLDDGINWSLTGEHKVPGEGEALPTLSYFLGKVGSLLNLNFDILSSFGTIFAIDLNLDASTNRSSILADTTMTALSGQEVKFQNTSTSRFLERETDPDTGKLLETGVVREVTSGLIIGINGWVSGDGMITMKVSSTVSTQAAGDDTKGTLPTTSEKVISTNLRTQSGKPVVISGLLEQRKTDNISKVPFLGDIPLLGLLFQKKNVTTTNTELTIYIVPHVEYAELRQADAGLKMERLYQSLVAEQ